MAPLHVAAKGGYPQVVEYLVSKKAEINVQDQNGVKMYLCDHTNNGRLVLLI